jgi:uncharacterized membrane protein YgcG
VAAKKELSQRARVIQNVCPLKNQQAQQQKVYPARRFARGAMACPACRHIFEKVMSACPQCGFSSQVALKKFPFPAPELTPVMDPSGKLSPEEAARICELVAKLRKRLPRLHFINCLVSLGSGVDLREFGFWLLNNGGLSEGEAAKGHAVLFLIDPKGKAISVTVGYALEPFVMDAEWTAVCHDCQVYFYRQKYGEGIIAFLNKAGKLLAERALETEKELRKK